MLLLELFAFMLYAAVFHLSSWNKWYVIACLAESLNIFLLRFSICRGYGIEESSQFAAEDLLEGRLPPVCYPLVFLMKGGCCCMCFRFAKRFVGLSRRPHVLGCRSMLRRSQYMHMQGGIAY